MQVDSSKIDGESTFEFWPDTGAGSAKLRVFHWQADITGDMNFPSFSMIFLRKFKIFLKIWKFQSQNWFKQGVLDESPSCTLLRFWLNPRLDPAKEQEEQQLGPRNSARSGAGGWFNIKPFSKLWSSELSELSWPTFAKFSQTMSGPQTN